MLPALAPGASIINMKSREKTINDPTTDFTSPESAGVEDVVEAVKTFSADVASAT